MFLRFASPVSRSNGFAYDDLFCSSSRRPTPPPADRQPVVLPIEDSIRFVLAMKREFTDKPTKNQEFHAVMHCFSLGM